MSIRTIFITGSTDGLGLETAKKLKKLGHNVIVHGRNQDKLSAIAKEFNVETLQADLSSFSETKALANEILKKYKKIDVLINNAGVLNVPNSTTKEGYDIRYMVNTFAPYILTKALQPVLKDGRVINLSSAAQSSVDFEAMLGKVKMSDFEAYAQSKLAITMWSRYLANKWSDQGPTIIAVNPGSLLATKMVKEGFNTNGKDVNIGVNILTSLSLDKEHSAHSGDYFDNDNGVYASPQADGLNDDKAKKITDEIDRIVSSY